MTFLARLAVATSMACCVTAVMIGFWAAMVWTLQPHWAFAILFMLSALGLHFFVVARAYKFVKERWF